MQFKISSIATTNNEVHVDEVYAYSEGSFIAHVKILDMDANDERLAVKLFVIKSNKEDMPPGDIFVVSTTYHNIGYSGMWRLWDIDRYGDEWF